MCSNKKNFSLSKEDIVGFTYPQAVFGKESYVFFYAYSPADGFSKRKRYKLNSIKPMTTRRKYASHLISKLSQKLEAGWNPWIECESSNGYKFFSDCCTEYVFYLTKMLNDDQLREKTFIDYNSKLQIFIRWNLAQRIPITYIYQVNRELLQAFLDHMYLEENNSPRTRNNYLGWLKSFSSFLVSKMYLKEKPTNGIVALRVVSKTDRTVIAENDLIRLCHHLATHNKSFLLACYILHYALIRPKEMSHLKLSYFSIERQTIFIPGSISKNRKDAIVTLPQKVLNLMRELKVFEAPGHYYLFGSGFQPAKKRTTEKQFRDYWAKLREELHYPITYKFYSLKDTGITNMLRTCDVISVRDQARHSSILMTNVYTPTDIQDANELLKNYKGKF